MILSEYDRELHIRSEKQLSFEEGFIEGFAKGFNKGFARTVAQGRLEGTIENILSFLNDLGPVPPELEKRIRSETDYTFLSEWLKLAARADTVQAFIDRISCS